MASAINACSRPPLRGDETELFRRHHRRLLSLIARDVVSARPEVIEDACAYAWLELIARQPARTNVVGWLRIVARREAIRLVRYDRRLAALAAEWPDDERAADRSKARAALANVAALPARKRAVLTLQMSGHSYREIAAELCMSQRTVERQLLRARAAVRHASHEALAA